MYACVGIIIILVYEPQWRQRDPELAWQFRLPETILYENAALLYYTHARAPARVYICMHVYDCDIHAVVCILGSKCHRRGRRPRYYNKHNGCFEALTQIAYAKL